jgi:Flp pilus assembly protein CpaB
VNTNRLLVGLGIALLVAFLLSTFVYKQFKQATSVKAVASQTLVVAAVPIPVGARLDPSNLRVIAWPGNEPVAGMFTRVEDCANRALITPLAEN